MKFLVSLLILVLVVGSITSVLAYPILDGTNVTIIQLKTPDYYVIPSNFYDEGEITVHVTFENDGTGPYQGLVWDFKQISNSTTNYDQIYEDSYHGRYIAVDINDVTKGTTIKLDRTLFTVTSDYNLKTTLDHTQGNVKDIQLEILDIEQNVVGDYNKKSTLEFEFTLSSPEFELDKTYEIDLFTIGGGSNIETFEFVDRNKKAQPESTSTVNTSNDIKIETDEVHNAQNESNLQLQQTLQQQRAQEEYEERKKQEELERQQKLDFQAEQERITSEIEQNRLEKMTKKSTTSEPQMDPEPVSSTTKEPECGGGMIAENGICVMINNEPEKEKSKGFLDWLFSLFG